MYMEEDRFPLVCFKEIYLLPRTNLLLVVPTYRTENCGVIYEHLNTLLTGDITAFLDNHKINITVQNC